MALESTTNSPSSGFVEDGAGRHRTSEGEENVALSYCHFPRVSAGASLLVQSLFLSPVLKICSIRAALMRTSMPNHTLRWALSFPNVHVALPCTNPTLRFGPKNFVPFRDIDLDFGGSMSWHTQLNSLEILNKATEPLPLFFFSCLFG